MVVKGMNRLKRKEEAKPPEAAEVPRDEKLLEEIRDILAAGNPNRPGTTPGSGRIPGTDF